MTIRGMIFDVDGTLVDTNPAHVEAWTRTFQRLGFQVSPERIVPEIGKGGDKLVPSILGAETEKLGEMSFARFRRRSSSRLPGTSVSGSSPAPPRSSKPSGHEGSVRPWPPPVTTSI